jgi:hypothetical protein
MTTATAPPADDLVTEEMIEAGYMANQYPGEMIGGAPPVARDDVRRILRAVAPLIAARLQAENKRLKCLLEDALDDRLDRYGRIKFGDTLSEHIAAAIRARGET